MHKPRALVSDFDGTISENDFFWLVVDCCMNESAMAPWHEYLAGKRSHLSALNAIFGQLRLSQAELYRLIKTIQWDHSFLDVAAYCQEHTIPLYICSAGCDYYINRLLGTEIQHYRIRLITNHGVYDPQHGLQMLPPPSNDPFYDPEVGISKAAVVKSLQKQGFEVIYAGDGPPDFAPAQVADVVFARKILWDECRKAGIPAKPFNSFCDVLSYMKEN